MRETKFRAVLDNGLIVDVEYPWVMDSGQGGRLWKIDSTSGLFQGYIVKAFLQFTGLPDKSGKEIYEGDIVENIGTGYSNDYEVRFGCGMWEIHSETDVNTESLYYFREIVEIIGNIYENPELLKEG